MIASVKIKYQIFGYTNKKKRWIEQFKVFNFGNVDIIINMGNKLLTFQNSNIRPYNCLIKEIDMIYLELTNNLAEIFVDKLVNKKILLLFNYFMSQKSYQWKQLHKITFTNNLIDKTTILFFCYSKSSNNKLALQL